MSTELRLLILEDSPRDADLVVATLADAGYLCRWDRVETREDFLDRLETAEYDLVLTDFSLPSFDGLSAIKLFAVMGLDIPIIQISGTMDEEAAVDSLKAGAADFVSKDKLFRLPHVVGRALKEAEVLRQRKRAEATLRESERKFRDLVEHAGDGIAMVDLSGRYRDVNSSFCAMLGYAREELLSMHAHEVTVPEESTLVAPALNEIAQGVLHLGEWRLRRKDGEVVPVEIKARKLPDGNLLGIVRDITERRKAEEHRDRLQRRNEALVKALAHIVYEWFPKKDEVRWDGDVKGILGYSIEEVGDNTEWWSSRLHSEDVEGVFKELEQARQGERLYDFEYRFRRSDGTYAWMEDRGVMTLNAEGEIEYMIGILGDITERKNLEEQFRQSQKMEAVGQLAGGIAHDFNNLLTVINGYSELLFKALAPDDPKRRSIDAIHEAGERAAALTGQLLAFSRKAVVRRVAVSLNEAVRDTEKMLRRLIGEHIDLTLALDESISTILIDPSQLSQVFVNLAVNARDAMPDGGKLTVETFGTEIGSEYIAHHPHAKLGRYVVMAVSDTGVGMSPEVKEHIFEPFFTTKGPGKGTGLGLATVYGIVKQAGGHIEAYSEPGRGSSFKIYFPQIATTEPGQGISGERPALILEGTETILIVEDEEMVRDLAIQTLRSFGYNTHSAADGAEAQLVAERHGGIDLLFTDVVMPGISGLELASILSEKQPGLKVLFASGYTDDAVVRHGMLDAGSNFLQKPYSTQNLLRKIREIFDTSE